MFTDKAGGPENRIITVYIYIIQPVLNKIKIAIRISSRKGRIYDESMINV